jgi:hypothetical protein
VLRYKVPRSSGFGFYGLPVSLRDSDANILYTVGQLYAFNFIENIISMNCANHCKAHLLMAGPLEKPTNY